MKSLKSRRDELAGEKIIVYGTIRGGHYVFANYKTDADTHKAELVNIEKLPNKECEHSPYRPLTINGFSVECICRHCGAKLEPASWKAVE